MPNPASQLTLLLPERRRFSGQAISPSVAKALARADRLEAAPAGEREQLLRHFDLQPRGWPMAAIGREADAGDASSDAWLRADPVFVRPDQGGARLMAWGNLGVSADEAEQFLSALRPIFSDAGLQISATAPERWVIRLPRDTSLPAFAPPADSLGEDLLAHLPEGPEGRRWRVLLNEAQVTLHNHPRNAERLSAGFLPVNSLWFWGGGVLPDTVTSSAACVISEDDQLLALGRRAGASLVQQEGGSTLVDLRRARDWAALEKNYLEPALANLKRRGDCVLLDFADGASFRLEAAQRWRLWRRPLERLDA